MKLRKRYRYLRIVLWCVVGAVFLVDFLVLVAAGVVDSWRPEVIAKCETCDEEIEEEEEELPEPENPRGTIYLTFDDGPGPYTAELLDILKKYKVKVTFFVTGAGDDELILREYQEGHAVGLHTMSHNYSYIYANADNFFQDLLEVQERVKNITGETSYLMRFPGGSSNTVSRRYDHGTHIMSYLTSAVEQQGFSYFDWNIASGDAAGVNDAEGVFWRVVEGLKDGDNVVLQHDIKDFSVAAVERIIQYGIDNNYKFSKLTKESYPAHHGINN